MRRAAFLLVAGLNFALSQVALAADLAVPAPSGPITPFYGWTGCYLGGNAGGAWGRTKFTNVSTDSEISGTDTNFAGGLQLGCDVQVEQLVVGFRNLFDGTRLKNNVAFQDAPLAGYSASSNTFWFDTLTGRVGFPVQPNWLWYVQGGGAWAQPSQSINDLTGAQVAHIHNNNRHGWTAGIGTEYMFSPNWSVFLEYNYLNFGTQSVSFTDAGACDVGCAVGIKRDAQTVLVGLNLRLGGL